MKKAILDTSFILTCVRQKIDFLEYLETNGFRILIPSEVINEIKSISESKKKLRFKEDALLALKLIKNHSFEKVNLDSKNVDYGIVKFANKDMEIAVGTLDSEIKKKVNGSKIVIREKKRLEVI
jgi:rRNA-processing protein FCF1